MRTVEDWDREFEELEWLTDKSMPKKRKLAILRSDVQKHYETIAELENEIAKLRNWIHKVKAQKYR